MSVTSLKHHDESNNASSLNDISVKNLSKNLSYTDLGDDFNNNLQRSYLSRTSGHKKNMRVSSPVWK